MAASARRKENIDVATLPHVQWTLRGSEGSPCFVVVDGFLPSSEAASVLAGARSRLPNLKHAGVGRGDPASRLVAERGDQREWVSSAALEAHSSGATEGLGGAMAALIELQGAVSARMPWTGVSAPAAGRSEAQLTCYPGGGARYTKHLDAFDAGAAGVGRRLTAILYLNPDWRPGRGGELRLDVPGGGGEAVEVAPRFGRLVLFLSDRVPHEVLPTEAPRWALTLWMHGPRRRASLPRAPAAGPLPGNDAAAAASAAVGAPAASPPGPAVPPGGAAVRFVVPRSPLFGPSPRRPGRIFVTVPAYREPDLVPTLQSLFEAARDPSRIRVGLFAQADEGADPASQTHPERALTTPEAREWAAGAVRVSRCGSAEAAGPVWARHVCWSMWMSEPFVLGVDAHTRFVEGFDDTLIHQLELSEAKLACGEGAAAAAAAAKAVLSTLPAAYRWPEGDSGPRADWAVVADAAALHLPTVMSDHGTVGADGFPRLSSSHFASADVRAAVAAGRARADGASEARGVAAEPLRSDCWGACLTFSRSAFWLDVPPDPRLRFLFFGEEPSTLARARSRGYAVFAPGEPVCLHRWERSGRNTFREHASGWRTAQQVAAGRATRRLLARARGEDPPEMPWPSDAGPAPAGCVAVGRCSDPCGLDAETDAETLRSAAGAAKDRVEGLVRSATLRVAGAGEPGQLYGLAEGFDAEAAAAGLGAIAEQVGALVRMGADAVRVLAGSG